MRLGSIHCRSSAMFWKPLNTSKLTWSMSDSEQVNVFWTPTKKRPTGAKFEWKEKKTSREKLFWILRRKGRKHNTMNTPNVGKQCWDVWLHITKVKYWDRTVRWIITQQIMASKFGKMSWVFDIPMPQMLVNYVAAFSRGSSIATKQILVIGQ